MTNGLTVAYRQSVMTNGLSVGLPVPCKAVMVVKHSALPSVKRLVVALSSPTPNASR